MFQGSQTFLKGNVHRGDITTEMKSTKYSLCHLASLALEISGRGKRSKYCFHDMNYNPSASLSGQVFFSDGIPDLLSFFF